MEQAKRAERPHAERERMHGLLERQREAYGVTLDPTIQQRRADLKRLREALVRHVDELVAAISEDFGNRARQETLFAEIMPLLLNIDHARRLLPRWARPDRRKVGMLFQPGRAHVHYQPLGVIGIIVPWNYPLQLSIGPLIGALAAGNRAMIKMSEYTPHCNEVVTRLVAEVFEEDHVAVVTGDAEVAAAFSALPFDHLLFTGSTAVGRHVMRAAAENLTPVTLELGGKSPAIIDPEASLDFAAERICFGKSLNAGQTCIAPDYVLCPRGREREFLEFYRRHFSRMYPRLRDNPDYTSIINERHLGRLNAWLEDAVGKGAEVVDLNPEGEGLAGSGKLAPKVVFGTSPEMKIRCEEIFGPILPVIPYESFDEALAFVRAGERPLALYYFGPNGDNRLRVLTEIHAGGVTINDAMLHFVQEDLPFGGIGQSGMGHYHGYDGFLAFSKAKAVYTRGRLNPLRVIYPPYRGMLQRLLIWWLIR